MLDVILGGLAANTLPFRVHLGKRFFEF